MTIQKHNWKLTLQITIACHMKIMIQIPHNNSILFQLRITSLANSFSLCHSIQSHIRINNNPLISYWNISLFYYWFLYIIFIILNSQFPKNNVISSQHEIAVIHNGSHWPQHRLYKAPNPRRHYIKWKIDFLACFEILLESESKSTICLIHSVENKFLRKTRFL
jgi:hypothetical protein